MGRAVMTYTTEYVFTPQEIADAMNHLEYTTDATSDTALQTLNTMTTETRDHVLMMAMGTQNIRNMDHGPAPFSMVAVLFAAVFILARIGFRRPLPPP